VPCRAGVSPAPTAMGRFLRENWIWILAPVVLVAGIIIAVVLWGAGDDGSIFVYPIN